MPSTPRGNSAQEVQESLLLLVGQLITSTNKAEVELKEVSSGLNKELKEVSSFLSSNHATLLLVNQKVGDIEKAVGELEIIVRSGTGTSDSLLTRNKLLQSALEQLSVSLKLLDQRITANDVRIDSLESSRKTVNGGIGLFYWLIAFTAWTITTAVAVVAAMKGN